MEIDLKESPTIRIKFDATYCAKLCISHKLPIFQVYPLLLPLNVHVFNKYLLIHDLSCLQYRRMNDIMTIK